MGSIPTAPTIFRVEYMFYNEPTRGGTNENAEIQGLRQRPQVCDRRDRGCCSWSHSCLHIRVWTVWLQDEQAGPRR